MYSFLYLIIPLVRNLEEDFIHCSSGWTYTLAQLIDWYCDFHNHAAKNLHRDPNWNKKIA